MQTSTQNISLVKQNILKFLEFKGITKYKFYQISGITRGVLDHKSGLSEDNAAKFIACFPEVNLKWLLKGEGEMISTYLSKDTEETAAKEVDQSYGDDKGGLNRIIEAQEGEITALKGQVNSLTKVVELLEKQLSDKEKGGHLKNNKAATA